MNEEANGTGSPTAHTTALPEPPHVDEDGVVYVNAQSFAAWLDERLLQKYSLDYARLLEDVRPGLLLLHDLRHNLEALATLFTFPPKQRKANSLHGGLAEGRSVLPYVQNAIHIASTLPSLPSLAVDSVSLLTLYAQMQEAIQLMLVNLHTLSHVEIDYQPLRNKFFRHARELNSQLGKLVYAVDQLQRLVTKHARFLTRIDSIKDGTSWEIDRLLASRVTIQETLQHARGEVQHHAERWAAAKRKYEALMANKDLAKGRLLEQQSRHALHTITHAVRAFVPLASALKAKKWTMTEGKDDGAQVNRVVNSATKTAFLEDVIAAPEQFVQALSKLRGDPVARKQEGLVEYCSGFEDAVFRDAIAKWRAATATLYKLQTQGNFKKKFGECKEAGQNVVHVKGELDQASEEMTRVLTMWYTWTEDWDALQQAVFDCCLDEFDVRVVLLEPTQKLTP